MERNLRALWRHRYAPLVGFAFVYLLLAVAVNVLVRSLRGGRDVARDQIPESDAGAVGWQGRGKQDVLKDYLIPGEEARKYDIQEQRPEEAPQDQDQWDRWVAKNLHQDQMVEELRSQGAFSEGTLSEEEINRQIRQLTAMIRTLEEKTKTHPQDEAAREELQGLYLMKSTLGYLERSAAHPRP